MTIFPLISIIVYLIILLFTYFGIIPSLEGIFNLTESIDKNSLLLIMGIIILLESIIYLGFYLPGQFIAIILIVGNAKSWTDIIPLTIVSIIAVTISAGINYFIGTFFRSKKSINTKIDWKKLLLSMIHINTLAMSLFEAGRQKWPKKIIFIVGLLNLPYYLILISLTFYYKDIVIKIGENPYYLLFALILWYLYTLWKSKKIDKKILN